MIRATKVLGQHRWTHAAADTVVLDFDDRHRRRMAMTGTRGLEFLLDLENAVALRGGDALVLEDGRLIEVVAAAEPLLEIRGADPLASGPRRLASRQSPSADADHAEGPAHPPRPRHRGDGEGAGRARHRDRGAVRSRRRRLCEQSRPCAGSPRACTCTFLACPCPCRQAHASHGHDHGHHHHDEHCDHDHHDHSHAHDHK